MLKIMEGTIASVPPQGGRKHPQQEFLHKLIQPTFSSSAAARLLALRRLFLPVVAAHQSVSALMCVALTSCRTGEVLKECRTGRFAEVRPHPRIRWPPSAGCGHAVSDLDEAALIDILTRPKNAIVKQFQRLFEMEDISSSEVNDEALEGHRQQGDRPQDEARVVCAPSWKPCLLDSMYELPGATDVDKVLINKDVVERQSEADLRPWRQAQASRSGEGLII